MRWLIALFLIPSLAFADCDWKTISQTISGSYLYSPECHIAVGKLKKSNDDLFKAIALKDKALQTANERAENWMNTSLKLESNFQKVESYQRDKTWIYFGAGILTVVASAYALRSISR